MCITYGRRLIAYGSPIYCLRLGDPGVLRGHEARTELGKAMAEAQVNFSEFCLLVDAFPCAYVCVDVYAHDAGGVVLPAGQDDGRLCGG